MSGHNPDQYTEPQAGLEPQKDKDEAAFAEWIMPDILAEIIFESMKRAGIPQTLENAKIIYLDILEDTFYGAVESCIDHNPAFANTEAITDPVES